MTNRWPEVEEGWGVGLSPGGAPGSLEQPSSPARGKPRQGAPPCLCAPGGGAGRRGSPALATSHLAEAGPGEGGGPGPSPGSGWKEGGRGWCFFFFFFPTESKGGEGAVGRREGWTEAWAGLTLKITLPASRLVAASGGGGKGVGRLSSTASLHFPGKGAASSEDSGLGLQGPRPSPPAATTAPHWLPNRLCCLHTFTWAAPSLSLHSRASPGPGPPRVWPSWTSREGCQVRP